MTITIHVGFLVGGFMLAAAAGFLLCAILTVGRWSDEPPRER